MNLYFLLCLYGIRALIIIDSFCAWVTYHRKVRPIRAQYLEESGPMRLHHSGLHRSVLSVRQKNINDTLNPSFAFRETRNQVMIPLYPPLCCKVWSWWSGVWSPQLFKYIASINPSHNAPVKIDKTENCHELPSTTRSNSLLQINMKVSGGALYKS